MTTSLARVETACWLPLFCGCLASVAFSTSSVSAQPAINTTSPIGVAPGQAVDVTLNGGNLAGAQRMWSTFGGEAVLSPDVENNGEDAASVVYRVTPPADAALGIHGIRVITAGGASSLRPLLIDDLATVAEAGGNNTIESAQAVTIPTAVDGRVDNLSRDFYQFEATSGQRVSFEVFARRIGSPLDASMFLYDDAGRELAYNDDAQGLSSDCQMVHTFAEAGTYTLEVRDIRYTGGANHVYRLRMGDFPCVNVPVPIGVQRGTSSRIDFSGISVEDAIPAWIDVHADSTMNWINVSTRRSADGPSAFATVRISDIEEHLEREPNNTPEQADRITLGASLNGRFDVAGDVDRFSFDATQGQRFVFTGLTRQVGAPTDLLLRIYDANGSQVATADDNGTNEGLINYTFPADGRFTLAVHVAAFGQWQPAMETLSFVLVAVPMSVLLGLAFGVFAYKNRAVEAALMPLLNIAQIMPYFSYLVPVTVLFGVGDHAGAIATIIFATPPMIRLTLLGLKRLPPEVIEAGMMNGCNKFQLLFNVMIPSARHDILVGCKPGDHAVPGDGGDRVFHRCKGPGLQPAAGA